MDGMSFRGPVESARRGWDLPTRAWTPSRLSYRLQVAGDWGPRGVG